MFTHFFLITRTLLSSFILDLSEVSSLINLQCPLSLQTQCISVLFTGSNLTDLIQVLVLIFANRTLEKQFHIFSAFNAVLYNVGIIYLQIHLEFMSCLEKTINSSIIFSQKDCVFTYLRILNDPNVSEKYIQWLYWERQASAGT